MKTIKIISIIILALLSSNAWAWLACNGLGGSFTCPECEGTNNLNQLIIVAGGFFLQSNSDYQIALKKIELSEDGLIDYIEAAIKNISNFNAKYFEIWEISKSLEYDPIVIKQLSQFDYYGYMLENNLNTTVFQRVEGFLKQGHVRELFKKVFEDSSLILLKLIEVRENLESGKYIDIKKYWRINQLFLELALFGQYTSEVLNTT